MIITVTSHKGGVGKTVTSIHLATFFGRRFGAGSTVVVDTDPNASSLKWSERAASQGYELPFAVVGPGEAGDEEHVIFDSPGRLYREEMEAVAEVSDLVVVPTSPDALSVDALAAFTQDFEDLGMEVSYRVLLTMVPWWNTSGRKARRDLAGVGIPLFSSQVRFRPAFDTAALEGLPVSELRSKGARDGWKDYSAVGEEVIGV
jgi:chromosome partitioning protein